MNTHGCFLLKKLIFDFMGALKDKSRLVRQLKSKCGATTINGGSVNKSFTIVKANGKEYEVEKGYRLSWKSDKKLVVQERTMSVDDISSMDASWWKKALLAIANETEGNEYSVKWKKIHKIK